MCLLLYWKGYFLGFGFVEMISEVAALKAIQEINQSTVRDLTILVSQMDPKFTPKGSYKVGNGSKNFYKFKKN